jgi:hypothetical protein
MGDGVTSETSSGPVGDGGGAMSYWKDDGDGDADAFTVSSMATGSVGAAIAIGLAAVAVPAARLSNCRWIKACMC